MDQCAIEDIEVYHLILRVLEYGWHVFVEDLPVDQIDASLVDVSRTHLHRLLIRDGHLQAHNLSSLLITLEVVWIFVHYLID